MALFRVGDRLKALQFTHYLSIRYPLWRFGGAVGDAKKTLCLWPSISPYLKTKTYATYITNTVLPVGGVALVHSFLVAI